MISHINVLASTDNADSKFVQIMTTWSRLGSHGVVG